MARRQILLLNSQLFSNSLNCVSGFANFSSKSIPYMVKVGIPEFLNGVGKGVEKHVEKLESEIGDLNKLLVTRTIKLKRLGIPCQDRFPGAIRRKARQQVIERKLILKFCHKYRLGLWRPRADLLKS